MMKNSILLTGLVLLLTIFSCDNEVNTTGDWQFIPVVYALFDVGEPAQYIRLEKAFLDNDSSGMLLAQVPDSLFFGDASVQLIEINERGRIEQTIDFFLIDATLDGLDKEEGLFPSNPNFLYKSTVPLNGDFTYELNIESFEDFEPITASSPAIGDFRVFTPTDGGVITFESGEETLISWDREPDAVLFDLTLTIHYREYKINNTNDFETKTIQWTLAKNYRPNPSSRLDVLGEQFLSRLANTLEVDANLCREILSFDLEIYAGGEELRLFSEAFFANQNGITGSLPFPRYTNLSTGIGLFSTRYRKVVRDIRPSSRLKDVLSFDPITRDLGFRSAGDECL